MVKAGLRALKGQDDGFCHGERLSNRGCKGRLDGQALISGPGQKRPMNQDAASVCGVGTRNRHEAADCARVSGRNRGCEQIDFLPAAERQDFVVKKR